MQGIARYILVVILGAQGVEPKWKAANSFSTISRPMHSRMFFQVGTKEEDLRECAPHTVCNKIDSYDKPWIERQCRCPHNIPCSLSLSANDGHTIKDKARLYKICEPTIKLHKCKFFHDTTWTLYNYPDNSTQQVVHCKCPRNSIAYIVRTQAFQTMEGRVYQYSFACSPPSKLRCKRKEPCRLFTVKKRVDIEEVNTNFLCHCPHDHHCPKHHTDAGAVPGVVYEEGIRTYSGYCALQKYSD